MTDITMRSFMTVDLIDHMGDDLSVVRAARVSTNRDQVSETSDEYLCKKVDREHSMLVESTGLINFLMKNRHGTPFEHNSLTFRIEAPIFVWREFHRHRIGFSYNEMSARYTEMPAVFYSPPAERNLIQVGKPGHYTFEPGTTEQYNRTSNTIYENARDSYARYEEMLADGVAREVARVVLPLNIYSICYVTCNARSLMSFLSLRTKDESALFPSFPQREIEMVGEAMEMLWAVAMPITHEAFCKNRRVSP